jgi:hypothetical protein
LLLCFVGSPTIVGVFDAVFIAPLHWHGSCQVAENQKCSRAKGVDALALALNSFLLALHSSWLLALGS